MVSPTVRTRISRAEPARRPDSPRSARPRGASARPGLPPPRAPPGAPARARTPRPARRRRDPAGRTSLERIHGETVRAHVHPKAGATPRDGEIFLVPLERLRGVLHAHYTRIGEPIE